MSWLRWWTCFEDSSSRSAAARFWDPLLGLEKRSAFAVLDGRGRPREVESEVPWEMSEESWVVKERLEEDGWFACVLDLERGFPYKEEDGGLGGILVD